jgi:hypothetical protein
VKVMLIFQLAAHLEEESSEMDAHMYGAHSWTSLYHATSKSSTEHHFNFTDVFPATTKILGTQRKSIATRFMYEAETIYDYPLVQYYDNAFKHNPILEQLRKWIQLNLIGHQ